MGLSEVEGIVKFARVCCWLAIRWAFACEKLFVAVEKLGNVRCFAPLVFEIASI